MTHYCSYCDQPFTALRKDKRFCSQSCKQMAFVKRQESLYGAPYPKGNLGNISYAEPVIESKKAPTVPEDRYALNIEKIKKELYAFAEVVIQNKLDALIKEMNVSNLKINDDATNPTMNPELNEPDPEHIAVLELEDEEQDFNTSNDDYEGELSIPERSITEKSMNERSILELGEDEHEHKASNDDLESDPSLSERSITERSTNERSMEKLSIKERSIAGRDFERLTQPPDDLNQSVNPNSIRSASYKTVQRAMARADKANGWTKASIPNNYAEPSTNDPNEMYNTSTEKAVVTETDSLSEEIYRPVKCNWIDELYDQSEKNGIDEKFAFPESAFGKRAFEVKWVSIQYRSLLECVLNISDMKAVEWDDLAQLTNAFTFVINSINFKDLPKHYPYKREIVLLKDKLHNFCLDTQGEEFVQFRLKFETKKDLLRHRFELSQFFPKISFKELQQDFKKETEILRRLKDVD